MISKREAKKFVLLKTIHSLRAYARRLRTADIGMKATEKDVKKVQAAMEELAAALERRLPTDVVAIVTHKEVEYATGGK